MKRLLLWLVGVALGVVVLLGAVMAVSYAFTTQGSCPAPEVRFGDEALEVNGYCSVFYRCGVILAKQQTLVLVQLFLAAAQIDGHSTQSTGHSGQHGDDSDQTRFLHRFSTLLFSVETMFQLVFPAGDPQQKLCCFPHG